MVELIPNILGILIASEKRMIYDYCMHSSSTFMCLFFGFQNILHLCFKFLTWIEIYDW